MAIQLPRLLRDTAINFGGVSLISLGFVYGMEIATGRHQHRLLITVWSAVAGVFAAQPLYRKRQGLSALLMGGAVYLSSSYILNAIANKHGRRMVQGIVGTMVVIGLIFALFTKGDKP